MNTISNPRRPGRGSSKETCEGCSLIDDCSSSFVSSQPAVRADGKIIGQIEGDCLYKVVSGSRHMLRNPRSWAIDRFTLQDAEMKGVKRIEILEKETGIVYHSPISEFWNAGIEKNLGFGLQLALPMKYWTTSNLDQPELPLGEEINGNS